jgi:hypothetical protein
MPETISSRIFKKKPSLSGKIRKSPISAFENDAEFAAPG